MGNQEETNGQSQGNSGVEINERQSTAASLVPQEPTGQGAQLTSLTECCGSSGDSSSGSPGSSRDMKQVQNDDSGMANRTPSERWLAEIPIFDLEQVSSSSLETRELKNLPQTKQDARC